MRSPTRIALVSSTVLLCSSPGCRRDPTPEPAEDAAELQPVQRVEQAHALTFEGHWEGTVGNQRMRSVVDRASMAPHGELGLCSFGIGCRVPYVPDALGPDGGSIDGKPRMCVLALRTADDQDYALLFAEPPQATITVRGQDLAIELRGVEDDTGHAVALRFAGRPPS